MARYEAGETLSSIAKTYDCSPPAISYVVSRSRARQPNGSGGDALPLPELHLIKAQPVESTTPAIVTADPPPVTAPVPVTEAAQAEAEPAPDLPMPQTAPPSHAPANGNGANGDGIFGDEAQHHQRAHSGDGAGNGYGVRPQSNAGHSGSAERRHDAGPSGAGFPGLPPRAAPQRPEPAPVRSGNPVGNPLGGHAAGGNVADQRRTLHLSLGNGPNGNGANGSSGHGEHAAGPLSASPVPQRPEASRPHDTGERLDMRLAEPHRQPEPRYGYPQNGMRDRHDGNPGGNPGGSPGGEPGQRREAPGNFIDSELRARVDGDIAAFLAAFDAALAQDTHDSRTALREATDRLLRAGARTRIELERLEARVPLPGRDGSPRAEPAWRSR